MLNSHNLYWGIIIGRKVSKGAWTINGKYGDIVSYLSGLAIVCLPFNSNVLSAGCSLLHNRQTK